MHVINVFQLQSNLQYYLHIIVLTILLIGLILAVEYTITDVLVTDTDVIQFAAEHCGWTQVLLCKYMSRVIVTYGCEFNVKLHKLDIKRINAFEMKCYHKILRIHINSSILN